MPRLLLTVFLALSMGGVAQAASHDRTVFIKDQDLDGDGKVTRDEYIKGRAQEFARMDANRDGGLTLTEYTEDFRKRLDDVVAPYPAERREAQKVREIDQVPVRFKVIDADGSGKITKDEFDVGGWRIFDLHDTQRDGVVTREEPVSKG